MHDIQKQYSVEFDYSVVKKYNCDFAEAIFSYKEKVNKGIAFIEYDFKSIITELRNKLIPLEPVVDELNKATSINKLFSDRVNSTIVNRAMTIDVENICGLITYIQYDMETGDLNGRIKPTGPKAELLKQVLDNNISVSFSIRAINRELDNKKEDDKNSDLVNEPKFAIMIISFDVNLK